MPTVTKNQLGLAVVLLPLLALFIQVALDSGPLAPIAVTTVTVQNRALSPVVFGIGTVEARYSQQVGPIATGRLLRLTVDVGDTVQAGQVIGTMDPLDLHERLATQQANLRRTLANQRAAAALIRDGQARQTYAQTQDQRYQKLVRSGNVSRETVEARRQELNIARANLQAARANAEAADEAAAQARAELAALHQQLDQLHLRAPRDGLVVARKFEPGTTLMAGQAVLEIVDSSSLWVNVRFDQLHTEGLRAGLPAQILLRSKSGDSHSGHVLRIEPLADAITEETLAKVAFDHLPQPLPPLGELSEVTVMLAQGAILPVIPNASVQRREGQLGVWRIQAGALYFVPVRLGASDLDGNVEVLDGLQPGDQLVQYSQQALTPHSRIRIVERLLGDAT